MGGLFQARLRDLSTLLQSLVAEHQRKQASLEIVMTKHLWLQCVGNIVDAVQERRKVNMTTIVTTVNLKNDLFADVFGAFAVLLNEKFFEYSDVEAMVQYVLEALDAVRVHAATLMANENEVQAAPAWFYGHFEFPWKSILNSIKKSIPCCAVCPNTAPPFNVCGQPLGGHDNHCSRRKVETSGTTAWLPGVTQLVSHRWPGAHRMDPRIQNKLMQLELLGVPGVFDTASEVSNRLHAREAGESGDMPRERLRSWRAQSNTVPQIVRKAFRCSATSSQMRCYLCADEFVKVSPLLQYFLPRDQCIHLCERCGETILPPEARRSNGSDHWGLPSCSGVRPGSDDENSEQGECYASSSSSDEEGGIGCGF